MRYSDAQFKAIVIAPMVSGTISMIASGALMIMILNSDLKLSVPCRRILFGLCFYDFVYSLACALSSIPVPKEEGIWGSVGNKLSCDFQGFIFQLGFVGSVFYNCSLSMYCLCVIRFSMTDASFKKKIEPFCHIISNVPALIISIYLLVGGNFNFNGNKCWVGPYPMGCKTNQDVACERGDPKLQILFIRNIIYTTFAIITVVLFLIVWTVISKTCKNTSRWSWLRRCNGVEMRQRRSKISEGENTDIAPPRQSYAIRDIEAKGSEAKCDDMLDSEAIKPKWKGRSISFDTASPTTDGPNKTLDFDLKAMRAKTRGQRLSMSSSQASLVISQGSADDGLQGLRDMKNIGGPHLTETENAQDKNRCHSPLYSANNLSTRHAATSLPLDGHRKYPTQAKKSKSPRQPRGHISSERISSVDNTQKQVVIQALLYILAFIATWVFGLSARIRLRMGLHVPFFLMLLSRILNPFQGLFNILVYTRPHISSLRRLHPEFSWVRAFCLTVKGGGDNDSAGQGRNGPISRQAKSKRLRDRIRRSHMIRMEGIRHTNSSMVSSFTGAPRL